MQWKQRWDGHWELKRGGLIFMLRPCPKFRGSWRISIYATGSERSLDEAKVHAEQLMRTLLGG